VNVFPCKQVFRFATDVTIESDVEEQFLENCMDETMESNGQFDSAEEIRVFLDMNIPRTLQDVEPDEVQKILERFKGSIDMILYAKTTGLIYQMNGDIEESNSEDEEDSQEEIEEESEGEDNEMDEESTKDIDGTENTEKKKTWKEKNDPFDGMTKQERQKLVKEQKKEKRANKMDKNLKKRIIAKSRAGNKR